MTDNGLLDALAEVLAPDRVLGPEVASEDYSHDECLTVAPRRPAAVVLVESTAEVSAVVKLAAERKVPITARGSGTGLSGAAIPAGSATGVRFGGATPESIAIGPGVA